MGSSIDAPGPEGRLGVPGGDQAGPQGEGTPPPPPETGKERRKVSLIAAVVINVITLITVAVIILAILLPGYRRSFIMARALEGAGKVLVVVETTENAMRENNTDFISSQDGLKGALQELVDSGEDNVWAYVRDNLPDRIWVEENLPEDMQEWLKQLYPSIEIPIIQDEEEGEGEEEGISPEEEPGGTEEEPGETGGSSVTIKDQ
ncbi:MAG: hypothetical protein ACOC78_02820 [Actinomycetota bacterium]